MFLTVLYFVFASVKTMFMEKNFHQTLNRFQLIPCDVFLNDTRTRGETRSAYYKDKDRMTKVAYPSGAGAGNGHCVL